MWLPLLATILCGISASLPAADGSVGGSSHVPAGVSVAGSVHATGKGTTITLDAHAKRALETSASLGSAGLSGPGDTGGQAKGSKDDLDQLTPPPTQRGTRLPAHARRSEPGQPGSSRDRTTGAAPVPAGPLQLQDGASQAQDVPAQPQAGTVQAQQQFDLSTVRPATGKRLIVLARQGYAAFDAIMFSSNANQVTQALQATQLSDFADELMNKYEWQVDAGQGLRVMSRSLGEHWSTVPPGAAPCNINPVRPALSSFPRASNNPPLHTNGSPYNIYAWIQDKQFLAEENKWGARNSRSRHLPPTMAEMELAYSLAESAIVVCKATSPLNKMQDWLEQGWNANGAFPDWIVAAQRADPKLAGQFPLPRLHALSDFMALTIFTTADRVESSSSIPRFQPTELGVKAINDLRFIVYQSIRDPGEHMSVIKAILAALPWHGGQLPQWPGIQYEIGDWAFDALIATEKFTHVAWFFAQRRKTFKKVLKAACKVNIFRADGDGAGVPSVLWEIALADPNMVSAAGDRHRQSLLQLEGEQQTESDASSELGGQGSDLAPGDKGKRPATDPTAPLDRQGWAPNQRQANTVGTNPYAGPQSNQPSGSGAADSGAHSQNTGPKPPSGASSQISQSPGSGTTGSGSQSQHTGAMPPSGAGNAASGGRPSRWGPLMDKEGDMSD